MNSNRLNQLQKFAEDDPDDPFNWYALALEYLHANPEKSLKLLDKLLLEFPDYLPAYYIAATQWASQGDIEKAAAIFRKGVEVAEKQNEPKTAAELRSGLEEITFE